MSDFKGRSLYLDTNVLIYAVEGSAEFESVLQRLFACFEDGRISAICSELALAEALIHPLRNGQSELVRIYESMLDADGPLNVRPVTRQILRRAAGLRAEGHGTLADAIHLATALAARCDHVLTNDRRFPRHPDIDFIGLAAFS